MKNILPYFIILIPLSFVAGGIFLAINGIGGWGWLIFCGLCTSGISIKTTTKKKK